MTLDLTLTPQRAALLAGLDTTVDVLIRVAGGPAPTAAEAETRARAPLNLALVIDRSGSMAGRPLEEARRCAAFIVQDLEARDRVAVVGFGSTAQLELASASGADKAAALAAIARLESAGMTALHDGWALGAEQALRHAAPGVVSRVLLLSDGQANRGLTDPLRIEADCARHAGHGVGTSTYGLGESFDEALLSAMARGGGGSSYYGETAEDLMEPFAREFDLMRAICAQRLRLRLSPAEGVSVELRNELRTDAEGIVLPDVAFGGAAWAMARLRVPAALESEPGRADIRVLTASLDYRDAAGAPRGCAPAHLRLPRVPAAAFASVAEDPEALARSRELRAAELQIEARRAALAGDWAAAENAIAQARTEAGDNEWVRASLGALERLAQLRDRARFGKEAMSKSDLMRRRLTDRDDLDWSPQREDKKASYLRRKREAGKGSTDGDRK